MIYFARAMSDGPIKIGQTKDIKARLKNLQMHLLGTRPGGFAEEKAIHFMFEHLRFAGTELFRPDQELLDFIAASAGEGRSRRVFRAFSRTDRERLEVIVSGNYRKWVEGLADNTRMTIPDLIRQSLFHYAVANDYRRPPTRI